METNKVTSEKKNILRIYFKFFHMPCTVNVAIYKLFLK